MTTRTALAVRPGTRRWSGPLLAALAFAAVAWFYAWTVKSAGGLRGEHSRGYYQMLVDGFRHGHLYLPYAPDPRLMALSDPYDPILNHAIRLPDASYYRGHYYLYLGPTPAVTLMGPFELLTGREISSGAAVLIFVLVGYAALASLWLAVRRRYFPDSSPWVGALGLVMVGLATHVLVLARRPDTWEVSIAAEFAWTMLALAAVYVGLHARRPVVAFAFTGLALGLAIGARPTALLAAVAPAVALGYLWQRKTPAQVVWRCAGAAALTLGLCIVGLLLYNYARFGKPLEFGQSYQLTSIREAQAQHFSLRYAWHNLSVYGFLWPHWTWDFPFVAAYRPGCSIPGYYGGEEMCGLFVTLPFLWLAAAAPLAWRGRSPNDAAPLRALITAVAGAGLAVGALIVCYFSVTERYVAEFAPELAWLAAVGLLALERGLPFPAWRRAGLIAVGAVGAVTAASAAMISFDYHNQLMRRTDPMMWTRLSDLSDEIVGRLAIRTGARPGPATFRVRFAARPAGTVIPLLRAGRPPAVERVLVRYQNAHRLLLGWQRTGLPPCWSGRLEYDPRRIHHLTVQMSSLYPPLSSLSAVERRAARAFRERTGMVLWLDGRPVLCAITPPGGGGPDTVVVDSPDIMGRLPRSGPRMFQRGTLPTTDATEWVFAGPPPAAGMIPLISWGRSGAGDLLALRSVGRGRVRLVYRHPHVPEQISPEFAARPDQPLTIEVEHGPLWPRSAPAGPNHPLVVWADGRIVWDTRVPASLHTRYRVAIGRNDAGYPDCPSAAPGWKSASPQYAAPGGTLRLRIVTPDGPVGTSEPLLVLGSQPGRADLLSIKYQGEHRVRIRFDHWGAPLLEGPPIYLQPGSVHVVEITVPSCEVGAFGVAGFGEIVVRVDGTEALRGRRPCYGFASNQWCLGRNDVGGSTCDAAFSGWILDGRWIDRRR